MMNQRAQILRPKTAPPKRNDASMHIQLNLCCPLYESRSRHTLLNAIHINLFIPEYPFLRSGLSDPSTAVVKGYEAPLTVEDRGTRRARERVS